MAFMLIRFSVFRCTVRPASRLSVLVSALAAGLAVNACAAQPVTPPKATTMPQATLSFTAAPLVTAASQPANAALDTDFPDAPLTYRKHILANGLTLLVHEDRKAPLVSVQVWYHVGSKDEVVGKTGFAHLFEHLMFNGSEHHDDEFFRPLESAGASDINGTTNVDRTNFYETVPTGALDLALWLESDRMGNLLPAVTQAKLDEQRGVVKNEKRQREAAPYAKADELIVQNSYPVGHPYSWTTIGSMEDLDRASLDDVRAWFKKYYGPNNATLVIAGDIGFEQAKAKAEQYFGGIAPAPGVARREQWIAEFDEPRRLVLHDRVTQARIYRLWNVPRRGSEDALHLSFAAELLAGDKASRLYQRLVTQEGLATSVQADVDANELGSQFGIIVTAKAGVDIARVEAVLDEEIAAFLKTPAAEADVQRRKTGYYVARLAGRESIAAKASELAGCQIFEGGPEACEREWLIIRNASPEQIRTTAARWLTPNHLTLTVLPELDLKPLVTTQKVDRSKLPAVGEPEGIQLPPLTTFRLSNGIEVLLAERHEVPLVNLEIFWPYGTAAQPGAGQFETLLGMLSEGANGLDAEQLTAAYGALGASFGGDLDSDSMGVTLAAPRSKLGEALTLFADNLRKPDFPADALARRVQRKLASLRANVASPGGILSLNQMRLMYGAHPYGRFNSLPLLEAASQSLTAEALRTLAPQVLRPDGARLLVVGDTTQAALQPLLEAAFGNWKPPASPALDRKLPAVVPPTARVFLFDFPGAEQSVVAAADLSLPVTDAQHEAADLANAVLGGLFTSRLNINLREQKNWTYGAFSGLQESIGPGLFGARANIETPHTADAMREMRREIAEIAGKRPPTPAELDAARKSLVRALPGQAETAGGVMGLYQRLLSYGLPTNHYSGYAARLAALSGAEVASAAAKLARPEALTWFVVGDLTKIEADIRKLRLGPVQVLNARGEVLR
ncbi:MAG: pitrilysin family protein [Pseudomonadota bacterium]